jgi:hypothetical protein
MALVLTATHCTTPNLDTLNQNHDFSRNSSAPVRHAWTGAGRSRSFHRAQRLQNAPRPVHVGLRSARGECLIARANRS